MSARRTVVWFRRDLRLRDNPALREALQRGSVVPVFTWAPEEEGDAAPGAAARVWLHDSLAALDGALRARGSRLVLRRGPSLEALLDVARAVGAGAVAWNRRHEPVVRARDERVAAGLRAAGLETSEHAGALLYDPDAVRTRQGEPYKVFTPFWRACGGLPEPEEPLPAPRRIDAVRPWPQGLDVAALRLEPRVDWAGGIREAWTPGLAGAEAALARFAREALAGYPTRRDRPDLRGTARLSPHLAFGEVSPRTVFAAVQREAARDGGAALGKAAGAFVRQVGWREFSWHLLVHAPHTVSRPLRPEFERFPWRKDADALKAWQRGQTGFPIVDAGMRELWQTGWMHNRVRMVVASFLVKDLLLPWQDGARWFWDTLVDADLANNTMGWQWTAGCGADAAPYFRVFNPVLQGKRFDPEGAYVRRFCPELAALPERWIHAPWEAPDHVLAAAGVAIGRNYPAPIVDHAEARDRALAAYERVKATPSS